MKNKNEKYFSNIKPRIIQYLNLKGFSKRSFYLKSGVSNGVLDKPSGISEENIERFISTYSEINPFWLITGKGEMLLENTDPPTETLNGVQEDKFDISPEAEINRTEFKDAKENVEWYKKLVDKQQNTIDEGLALQKSLFMELQQQKGYIEKLVITLQAFKNKEEDNDIV